MTFIVRFIREVMMGCHSVVSENVPKCFCYAH